MKYKSSLLSNNFLTSINFCEIFQKHERQFAENINFCDGGYLKQNSEFSKIKKRFRGENIIPEYFLSCHFEIKIEIF